MPSNIWTRCGGRSNLRRLAGRAWRVVESQHLFSTRKLVDSDEEQRLLEQLIEDVKPPSGAPPGLHWLLFTPFRYPPLRHGSRFGTRAERGIWYGSRTRETAFAEKAYYLLLFLEGTSADLAPMETDVSIFQAAFETARGVDLTRAPFERYVPAVSSPTDYADAQALGRDMRADGVEAFLYVSARDAGQGVNFALFDPAAFSSRRPTAPETWRCVAASEGVEVTKEDVFRSASFSYPRKTFTVAGRLPAPAF
jgi:hypothetical protein